MVREAVRSESGDFSSDRLVVWFRRAAALFVTSSRITLSTSSIATFNFPNATLRSPSTLPECGTQVAFSAEPSLEDVSAVDVCNGKPEDDPPLRALCVLPCASMIALAYSCGSNDLHRKGSISRVSSYLLSKR